MLESLRIIFAGTPDFAARHLDALIHAQYQVVGVLTQPDRPAGRGRRLRFSPVKQLAKRYNLPIFQPSSLQKPEEQEWLSTLRADIMVVVAYSLILPQTILELPRFGCINVHGSLLPRWRGAAPIQRALLSGDDRTGVTIVQMDAGIDTGAMLHKVTCAIEDNDTSASLYDKLMKIGPDALLFTLKRLASGSVTARSQDSTLATYAHKISKDEACLNWRLPAVQLERCIRAFNPWPISYFLLSGQIIKVWSAISAENKQKVSCVPGMIIGVDKIGIHISTGQDILTLTRLQPAGKKVMSVQDLLNSRREWFIPGTLLN